jgi:hypothetical protein
MHKKMMRLAICIAAFAMSAAAQTVTGSGTSGTVPVFTGSSTVGNSVITQSGSNVGIGTTAPATKLEVNGNEQVDGYLNTNYLSASGITIQSNPQAIEGWGWDDNLTLYTLGASGTVNNNQLVLDAANGNVGIGTTTPVVSLDVANGILHVAGSVNPPTTSQGAYLGWNALTGGTGETDFINNQGGGPGGFAFMNTPPGGSPKTTLMFLTGTGNVGIGTTAPAYKLDVAGQIRSSSGGVVFPDGSTQTTAWTGVLCGGDYAEAVNAKGSRKSYEPGDVLVIGDGAEGEVQKSAEPYSTMVAGIFATRPGVIGRRQSLLKDGEEIPMAMVGIVPTKVTAENGPIKRGDLLVTSSTTGYAMKGTDRSRLVGAVIGKAMGSLDTGTGVIEVLVTLQ